MSSLNDQIKDAIDSFDVLRARELLREALKDADADTFYLASMVALNDNHKKDFLKKALDLNPFHEQAFNELEKLDGKPAEIAPPATTLQPVKSSQPQQTTGKLVLSVEAGVQIKEIFNRLGYKLPDNVLSKDYPKAFLGGGLRPMDTMKETVVIHVGLNRPLTPNIQCLAIGVKSNGVKAWQHNAGNVVFTNLRIILLDMRLTNQKIEYVMAKEHFFSEFARLEVAEKSDHTQYSLFSASGNEFVMNFKFPTPGVGIIKGLKVLEALTSSNTKSPFITDYMRDRDSEQKTNAYVASIMTKTHNIKEAFTSFMKLAVSGSN